MATVGTVADRPRRAGEREHRPAEAATRPVCPRRCPTVEPGSRARRRSGDRGAASLYGPRRPVEPPRGDRRDDRWGGRSHTAVAGPTLVPARSSGAQWTVGGGWGRRLMATDNRPWGGLIDFGPERIAVCRRRRHHCGAGACGGVLPGRWSAPAERAGEVRPPTRGARRCGLRLLCPRWGTGRTVVDSASEVESSDLVRPVSAAAITGVPRTRTDSQRDGQGPDSSHETCVTCAVRLGHALGVHRSSFPAPAAGMGACHQSPSAQMCPGSQR